MTPNKWSWEKFTKTEIQAESRRCDTLTAFYWSWIQTPTVCNEPAWASQAVSTWLIWTRSLLGFPKAPYINGELLPYGSSAGSRGAGAFGKLCSRPAQDKKAILTAECWHNRLADEASLGLHFLHLMSDFLSVFGFGDFILEWSAGSRSWQGHTHSQHLSAVVLCLFVVQRWS